MFLVNMQVMCKMMIVSHWNIQLMSNKLLELTKTVLVITKSINQIIRPHNDCHIKLSCLRIDVKADAHSAWCVILIFIFLFAIKYREPSLACVRILFKLLYTLIKLVITSPLPTIIRVNKIITSMPIS